MRKGLGSIRPGLRGHRLSLSLQKYTRDKKEKLFSVRAHTNGRNLCCSVSKWNGAACLRIKLAYLFGFFLQFFFSNVKSGQKCISLRIEEENNKIENKYKVGTRAFLGTFIGRYTLYTRKRPFDAENCVVYGSYVVFFFMWIFFVAILHKKYIYMALHFKYN